MLVLGKILYVVSLLLFVVFGLFFGMICYNLNPSNREKFIIFIKKFNWLNWILDYNLIFVCIMGAIIFGSLSYLTFNSNPVESYLSQIKTAEKQAEILEKENKKKELIEIADKLSLNANIIHNWNVIFGNVGISITNDDFYKSGVLKNGNKSYTITHKFNYTTLDYILEVDKDYNIVSISCSPYYLYKDGKIMSNVKAFDSSDSDLFYCKEFLRKRVLDNLKAPSTAVFPESLYWNTIVRPDYIVVKAYVDSQNSFGAMVRSDFSALFKKKLQYDNKIDYNYYRLFFNNKLIESMGN